MMSIDYVYDLGHNGEDGVPLDEAWMESLTPDKFCPHCLNLRWSARSSIEDPVAGSKPSTRCSYATQYGWQILDRRFFDVVDPQELGPSVRIQPILYGESRLRSETHVAVTSLEANGVKRGSGKSDREAQLCFVCRRIQAWPENPYLLREYWPKGRRVALISGYLMTTDADLGGRLRAVGLKRICTENRIPIVDSPKDGLPAGITEMANELERLGRISRPKPGISGRMTAEDRERMLRGVFSDRWPEGTDLDQILREIQADRGKPL